MNDFGFCFVIALICTLAGILIGLQGEISIENAHCKECGHHATSEYKLTCEKR